MKDTVDELTAFVLLFLGRCGSTYLIEALDDHPNIIAFGEALAAMKAHGESSENQLRWSRMLLGRPGEGEDHVSRLVSLMQRAPPAWNLEGRIRSWSAAEGSKAIGFKTKLVDVLIPDDFAQLLRELEVKVIHLWRRNDIKQAVSILRGMHLKERTGEWNLYDGERPPPVRMELGWLRRVLERLAEEQRRLNEYVERLDLPTHEVVYEDLLTEPERTLEGLLRFLGVAPQPISGRSKKATSDDLRTAVSNFEELRSHFVGTTYEGMFDEVLIAQERDTA